MRSESRGGKVSYEGEPKCDWRRRMADDGKKIVRLIQHKGKVVLQKAVLLGAEDEEEEEEDPVDRITCRNVPNISDRRISEGRGTGGYLLDNSDSGLTQSGQN